MKRAPAVERRKHRRVRLDGQHIEIVAGQRMSCQLLDISRVGAAARVAASVPEMSLVSIDLTLGGKSLPKVDLQCQAAVVRSQARDDGTWEIGLFFLELPADAQRALDRFIDASGDDDQEA